MPDEYTIDNMWTHNDDGAGLMYAEDGMVHIEKGFMEYERFVERLEFLQKKHDFTKLPVVMHFRITTHGGTKPENTHPFPITDSIGKLRKLKQTVPVGVAHNGIIDITPRKDISDTMEYIASQLAPLSRAVPEFYKNKDLMLMISNATESKLAFLTGKGDIYTIGNFVESKGIKYSNYTYSYGGWYRNGAFGCYSGFDNLNFGGMNSGNPDYWDSLDSGMTHIYRDIMWLDESKGEFVITPTNQWLEGDYGIDFSGNVFVYNQTYGCLVKCPNYNAYNSNGTPLRYNKKSKLITKECILV